jgi:hypothetical protein
MIDLNSSVVIKGGLVDVQTTLQKVELAITEYNETRIHDLDAIEVAVNAVFDEYPGANVTLPTLQTMALKKLDPKGLQAIKVVTQRIADYVRDNSGQDGSFWIKKGSGCLRVSDLTKEGLAQRAESFAALAAKAVKA